jgi:fumarylacetoacetase
MIALLDAPRLLPTVNPESDTIDFSCSLEHVKNAGRIVVNNENPPPAFFNMPIGYQGRAGSVLVSGMDVERPVGQFRSHANSKPTKELSIVCGPSAAMDYEVELALVVGKPLGMRQRLDAAQADDHIFGYVMVNDWSGTSAKIFQ